MLELGTSISILELSCRHRERGILSCSVFHGEAVGGIAQIDKRLRSTIEKFTASVRVLFSGRSCVSLKSEVPTAKYSEVLLSYNPVLASDRTHSVWTADNTDVVADVAAWPPNF